MNVETALMQFRFSHQVARMNIGDVTHEESLLQPKPAGNCLNWVLGHLVATRSNFIALLGGEPVWSEAESKRYDRHGPPLLDAAEAWPLAEIWEAFDLSQERLLKAVGRLTPERLAEKSPVSPTGNPDETIGSLLATFAFHDAYHVGQTGLLRRIVGKPPADL